VGNILLISRGDAEAAEEWFGESRIRSKLAEDLSESVITELLIPSAPPRLRVSQPKDAPPPDPAVKTGGPPEQRSIKWLGISRGKVHGSALIDWRGNGTHLVAGSAR